MRLNFGYHTILRLYSRARASMIPGCYTYSLQTQVGADGVVEMVCQAGNVIVVSVTAL